MDEENNIPVTPSEPTPTKSPNKRLWILVGALVLLIVGAAAAALWRRQQPPPEPNNNGEQNNHTDEDDQPQPAVKGEIIWETPKQISSLKLLKPTGYIPDPEGDAEYYEVGTVKEGKYQGGKVIILRAPCDGPCGPVGYRLISLPNKIIFLKKYSGELYDGSAVDETRVEIDKDYQIPELELPETIRGPKDRQVLTQTRYPAFSGSILFFDASGLESVFDNQAVGKVYENPENGGYYVKVPDGTLVIYELTADFVEKDNVPQIIWSGNIKNTQEYIYTDVGGCGSRNYISIVSLNISQDLKQTGTNSKGDPIYEFKDPNHQMLKDQYENRYNPYNEPKVNYDEFVKTRPMFFWADPFGRLIKFENNKFIPQAECAKPVIYLYPESPRDISVKVKPQGGFLYTEPDYQDGWVVHADTESNITDLASGKTYPYLFWEGRGGIYEQPKKGFVVKKAEVHAFLQSSLTKLGLNQKEIADFSEFWEPRMQTHPYYFITFLGNREMDSIAPLEISPAPDTVIRVLMDFSGLDKPISVEGYRLSAPERKGFTVIEWGGVIQ